MWNSVDVLSWSLLKQDIVVFWLVEGSFVQDGCDAVSRIVLVGPDLIVVLILIYVIVPFILGL